MSDTQQPQDNNIPEGKANSEYSLGEKCEVIRQGVTMAYAQVGMLRISLEHGSISREKAAEALKSIEELLECIRGGAADIVDTAFPVFRDKEFEGRLATRFLKGLTPPDSFFGSIESSEPDIDPSLN